MVVIDGFSTRETQRLPTRDRLLGAAIAKFKLLRMAEADMSATVAATGVAHNTFFVHFPTNGIIPSIAAKRTEIVKQLSQFFRVVWGCGKC